MKIKNRIVSKSMNKGITLIALVVTITILLILAGISIAALTGDNGLINRAGDAKNATEIAQEKEILQQASVAAMGKNKNGEVEKTYLDAELDKNPGNSKYRSNSTSEGIEVTFTESKRSYLVDTDGDIKEITVMPTVAIAPTEPVAENTKYDDGTNKADGTSIAVIPKGFKVINGGDNPKIDDGLVVKDGANNEWVWIPVADASVMYTHVDEGIAITGGPGKTYVSGVTTNYYSKGGIISGVTRGLPNVTSSNWREPDVVVSNGTDYDAVEVNYTAAGFTSLQNMAQSLVDDYEEMIASVEKNKGFYVGRYELTGSVSSPTEVAGIPLASQNWYNLYKACKGFTVEGVVESRMIWGCQWDAIMLWMLDSDDTSVQTYVTDSTNKGNYSGSRINTGSNSSYVVNGIFDLAGNCWEWTQEAYNANNRANRGRLLRF